MNKYLDETTHEVEVTHFELKHIFAILTSMASHNILPFHVGPFPRAPSPQGQ